MSSARPRALMIAPAMPATSGNGLAMRLGLFLEALSRFAETDLIVVPVAGSADASPELVRRLGVRSTVVPVAGRADTQFQLLLRLVDPQARVQAFRQYGRGSLAAYLSPPVLAAIRTIARSRAYDLIHAGRAYMADAALAAGGEATPLTLDADEDDVAAQTGVATLALRTGRPERADWAFAEADAADRLLSRVLPRFAALFVSGPADRRSLWQKYPGISWEIIPNAVDTRMRSVRSDDGRTLLFVGSYGYGPNADAALWFAQRLFPEILRHARPSPRLWLVGADSHAALARLRGKPGIKMWGPVAHLQPIYARATLVIAPLRAGGGTRIKLIEAAAHGVPMVATAVAAAGLPFVSSRSAWIANGESEFAAAVLDALAHPAERRRRAAVALAAARLAHDRSIVVNNLACRLSRLLAK